MKHDNFWSRHRSAVDAGLNKEWALKVAYGCISLEDALGDMEMNLEAESAPVILAVEPVSGKEYDCGCRGSASCRECIPF